MKILYIGDIMGEMGIKSIEKFLPEIVKTNKVDFVVAQAENVTDGKGISLLDYLKLKKIGIDAFTGGNWSLSKETIIPSLNNPEEPIVRPANYPSGTEGLGYKLITKNNKKILIISLLGQIVGRDSKRPMDNPLITADNIIEKYEAENPIIVVNFHGDFSSEKKVIGYYLDGRASLVVGDHWHIPTADAMVLPKGTAHITDVGMCGSLDSSLGVKLESIINRWKENTQTMNILEDSGRIQFNAVLADIDEKTHKATNIEQIQKIV
jgi:metallophosphoesterase (TIGR00282 family)